MKTITKEMMLLSPVELADELSMNNKEYIIVEGNTDKLLWEHLQKNGLRKRYIRIANKKECSGNKEYVKKVISIMNSRNKTNAIGIVDLDYDFVQNKVDEIDNLLYYKFIDLENVLIESNSFVEVNTMISSSNKKMTDEELRKIIYEKTYIVGILRLLNDIEGYNFSFEDIDYKRVLNSNSQEFLEYFMSRMCLSKNKREEICNKVKKMLQITYDKHYICNGHDLLNVLSLLTKKEISNDNPIRFTEDVLEKMLILGYTENKSAEDIYECVNTILTYE